MSGAPEGFTNAQWHTDAIADSGDGYTTHPRQYVISCLWCSDVFWGPTKAAAKSDYDDHVDAMYAEQEAERQATLVSRRSDQLCPTHSGRKSQVASTVEPEL